MATTIHDLVCIHVDNNPAFFARVEDIVPDVKPGWWKVRLLVLTSPLQVYTWILEEDQINGTPFTMGGTPIFLEKVVSPVQQEESCPVAEREEDDAAAAKKKEPAKVVSLFDHKKDK